MHTIVLVIIINHIYPKLSALARVRPRWGNHPKLIWAQYLVDLIWSCFSLQNMHAYSANRNHSWLRGGGQATQLSSSCTREKQEGTTFIASLLPPSHSQLKQHWLIEPGETSFWDTGNNKTSGLMANKHPQFKLAEATGLKSCVESQTPCHSSSHTHTKDKNRPPSPFPLSRCLTLTRLLRLGCSAWSSFKQTQSLTKVGERGTELPSLITTFKITQPRSPQHFICFIPFVVAICFCDFEYRKSQPAITTPWNKKKTQTQTGLHACISLKNTSLTHKHPLVQENTTSTQRAAAWTT